MSLNIKKVGLHVVIIFTIVLIVSIAKYLIHIDNNSLSFAYYFLQALTGVIIIMIPPVYINIYWLIPKFLAKKKYVPYFLIIICIIIIWGYLVSHFEPWTDEHWFDQPSKKMMPKDGILALIFIISISTLIHLSYRWFIQLTRIKQIENDRLQYELSLLKNQIKPHFFFNTLNNLYALSLEQSQETPKVILKLSEMLRYTIYDCKEAKVSIGKEVTYIENYIALQEIRHYKRGEISFNKEILNPTVYIAPMILIVFIENAFKHGVEKMEQDIFLDIDLKVSEKELFLRVRNNYDPSEINSTPGLGLENVKRRLSLLYPNLNELVIKDTGNIHTVTLKLVL
ncbi:sensor histidine kinase [Aquimarina sp. 2201CG5-10]|uniref:sensor histidine kinase n=1 Tax=Aquimarina callyspongiae TaxID=3098150 RepID=UPI002AB5390B|nr:sensor histidine kinase [Aquimarina sp. 2201CG5-10]MDY8135864.1 sensor histidine kinase [Aquimarina sp. 2201CG5-10]